MAEKKTAKPSKKTSGGGGGGGFAAPLQPDAALAAVIGSDKRLLLSCSSNFVIFSTALRTVASKSFWKAGLSPCRSAFRTRSCS